MAGPDRPDGVREEFLAEAQEIIETLSRDLLLLDQSQKRGQFDPDLVNEVFRGVHTLKGIAGMFGYHQLGAVAHALEDVLDDLRLGRVNLTQEVLDVLFEGVENFQRLLSEEPEQENHVDLQAYARSIERVSGVKGGEPVEDPIDVFALDPSVLAVLTEYEEHRLRTNIEQGVGLFRLRVRFPLTSIDAALEDLKSRAKPVAEIITYLPSMGGGDGETIDIDVLLASRARLAELEGALSGISGVLTEVERRVGGEALPPASSKSRVRSAPPPMRSTPPSVSRERDSNAPPPPSPPARARDVEVASASFGREAREAGLDAQSLRSITNTVRVDIRKLDHLMSIVGELAIVRSSVSRILERIRLRPELRKLGADLHRVNRSFERQLEELQTGILDVRMVPLGQVFDKLGRIVRQVAREHEKEIRLVVTGAETEVDKLIVEELSDPLMHIIRNAIDHGIELPKAREIAGKPAVGTVALNAYQKGNHVVIEVEDDGAGISEEKVLRAAVHKGLLTEEAAQELTTPEALGLIFAPGFTTRANITEVSGRGFGMDVVKTNITRLGGIIDVQSEVGIGSKFTITLPITLAIIRALLVDVVGRTYAIPLSAVQEALTLDSRAIRTVEGREVITLRGATLPICRLDRLFRHERPPMHFIDKNYVVVTALGQRRIGLVVDALHGQQDIVIKSLGRSIADVRGFSGATDLGDQRVALVLDAPSLLDEVLGGSDRKQLPTGASA